MKTNTDDLSEQAYRRIEEHYRTNHRRLFQTYGRSMGSYHLGEEVVQEAYTRALQYNSGLSPETDIDMWMGLILRNCSLRARKVERAHGIVDYRETEEAVKPAAIPAILLGEVQERIRRKPEDVARILTLVLIEQYTPREAADVLPSSSGAIRVAVHRFREEIRKEFNWTI